MAHLIGYIILAIIVCVGLLSFIALACGLEEAFDDNDAAMYEHLTEYRARKAIDDCGMLPEKCETSKDDTQTDEEK